MQNRELRASSSQHTRQQQNSIENRRATVIKKYRSARAIQNSKQQLREYLEILGQIPPEDLDPKTTGSQLRIIARDILLEVLQSMIKGPLPDSLSRKHSGLELAKLLVKISPQRDSYEHLKGIYYRAIFQDEQLKQQLGEIMDAEYQNDIYRRDAYNEWEETIKKLIGSLNNGLDTIEKLMKRGMSGSDNPQAMVGINKKDGDNLKCDFYFQLGNLYKTWADLDDEYIAPSFECYLQASQLAKQLSRETTSGGVYYNMGCSKLRLKQYGEAIKYLNEDLKICLKVKDVRGAVQTWTKLADCYEANLELQKASDCLKKAKTEVLNSTEVQSLQDLTEELEQLIENNKKLGRNYQELLSLIFKDQEAQSIRPLNTLSKEETFRLCQLVLYCDAQTDFVIALKKTYPELTHLSSTGRSDDLSSLIPTAEYKLSSQVGINPLMSRLMRQNSPSTPSAMPASDILRPLVAWIDYLVSLVPDDPLPLLNAVLDMMTASKVTKKKSLPLLKRVLQLRTQQILDLPPGAADKVPVQAQGSEQTQLRSPLEVFVSEFADYANILDDCFYHKDLSQVPAVIEEEFAHVLSLAVLGNFKKLVAVILVNMEIIYKKYKDHVMVQRVVEQIEKFKAHDDPSKVMLVISKRAGAILEDDIRCRRETLASPNFKNPNIIKTNHGEYDALDPLGLKQSHHTRNSSGSNERLPRFIEEEHSNQSGRPSPRFVSSVNPSRSQHSSAESFQPKSHGDRLRLIALSQMQSGMTGVSFMGIGSALNNKWVAEMNLQEVFQTSDLKLGGRYLDERSWIAVCTEVFQVIKSQRNLRLKSVDLGHILMTSNMVQCLVDSSQFYLSSIHTINMSATRMRVTDGLKLASKLNPLISEVYFGGAVDSVDTNDVNECMKLIEMVETLLAYEHLTVLGLQNLTLATFDRLMFSPKANLLELRLTQNKLLATELLEIIYSVTTRFPSLQRLDLSYQDEQMWEERKIPQLDTEQSLKICEDANKQATVPPIRDPEQLKGRPVFWIDLSGNPQFVRILAHLIDRVDNHLELLAAILAVCSRFKHIKLKNSGHKPEVARLVTRMVSLTKYELADRRIFLAESNFSV